MILGAEQKGLGIKMNIESKQNKITSLVLYLGVIFYLIGAIVHVFGLTLFPWFISDLYSAYHDTLIAISSLGMAILFFQGARHPGNKELVNTIMYMAFICSPLIVAMGLLVNFHAYGAGAEIKSTEAIIEGVMGIALGFVLWQLRRKDQKNG